MRLHPHPQNKSSCQSTLSLIVNTTVVFALILFTGVSPSRLPSSNSSSLPLTLLCPPLTSTLCLHGVPALLLCSSSADPSCNRLKLRSWTLLPERHEYERSFEGFVRGLGLWAPPHMRRTKRGRREGRQADMTAVEGSAAVQMEAET